jgi:hypothetical protein
MLIFQCSVALSCINIVSFHWTLFGNYSLYLQYINYCTLPYQDKQTGYISPLALTMVVHTTGSTPILPSKYQFVVSFTSTVSSDVEYAVSHGAKAEIIITSVRCYLLCWYCCGTSSALQRYIQYAFDRTLIEPRLIQENRIILQIDTFDFRCDSVCLARETFSSLQS